MNTVLGEHRRSNALRFVIGIGIVSLFGDFTYEGGRSIVGPYLAMLGGAPVIVGLVAGLGEFLGYAVRLLSGRFVDRTHRNWQIMGIGYTLNLLSVPALALVPMLWPASALVFGERIGKGLRNPPRDALLSRAGRELGNGFAFGLHEFLDQTGAVIGPLTVAAAVAYSGYRLGFAILIVPALLALFSCGVLADWNRALASSQRPLNDRAWVGVSTCISPLRRSRFWASRISSWFPITSPQAIAWHQR